MLPSHKENDLLARLASGKVSDGYDRKADVRLWVRDILVSESTCSLVSAVSKDE